MKTFALAALTGVVLFVLGVVLYLPIIAEVRADIAPSQFENKLIIAAVHASIRRQASEVSNPIAPTEEDLIAGGKLFISGSPSTAVARVAMFANGKWYPDKDLWAMAAYVKRIRDLPPTVQKALVANK